MNATRASQDAARLAIAIGRINRRIRASEDGMTHGQLSVLSTVVRRGPLRPSDIARREHLAPPSVTRLVADLESRGLVRREPDPVDRRSFFVLGTPQGEEAVLRARAERAERISGLLAALDDDEHAAVVAALDALERMAEPG
jgi:DNA-binding MarR family transcriptional regulator